jgi:hypothetical protein
VGDADVVIDEDPPPTPSKAKSSATGPKRGPSPDSKSDDDIEEVEVIEEGPRRPRSSERDKPGRARQPVVLEEVEDDEEDRRPKRRAEPRSRKIKKRSRPAGDDEPRAPRIAFSGGMIVGFGCVVLGAIWLGIFLWYFNRISLWACFLIAFGIFSMARGLLGFSEN